MYKHHALNELASGSALNRINPFETMMFRKRIARIYQPQARHLQDTPERVIGDMWRIELETFG